MQGPPPPEAYMEHIVQNPAMDLFFLPDGRSLVLRDKRQTPEKPVGLKKQELLHAATKKPKENLHGNDVNPTHFPSRVSCTQANQAFEELEHDTHPARQKDGSQDDPKQKLGAKNGKRAVAFFDDERPYFVRLPHNKVERFPSATTITPAYIEALEKESGSVYHGECCNHSTCHLPDHMVGWSQYSGGYLVCPRRFDPELHKVLNPRSINRLTLGAYKHFQEAHRNEESVLLYHLPTIRMSSVNMVEMPVSLVNFVETLTAFEVQQILIGKLGIDRTGSQGWFLRPRNVFIPKYALWTDTYVAAPRRVSGCDAFEKSPSEDTGEFLGRLTDSAYYAFLCSEVTAARSPEGWYLALVPSTERHIYGLTPAMDIDSKSFRGVAYGGTSDLSVIGKSKDAVLEGKRADNSELQAVDPPFFRMESKKHTPLKAFISHIGHRNKGGEISRVRWLASFDNTAPNGRSLGEIPRVRMSGHSKFAPTGPSTAYSRTMDQKRIDEEVRKALPSLQKNQMSQVHCCVDCVDCRWPTTKFGSSRTTKNPQPTVARHPMVMRRSTVHPIGFSPPRSKAPKVKLLKHSRPLSTSPHDMHRSDIVWNPNNRRHADSSTSLYQGVEGEDWFHVD
ncbi:hypothetical protein PSPO01_05024 [Paraphaeosphaeria sporulosa]